MGTGSGSGREAAGAVRLAPIHPTGWFGGTVAGDSSTASQPAAGRLQITRDLAGSGQGSYRHGTGPHLRGRYAEKHPWPRDPLHATATDPEPTPYNGRRGAGIRG